MYFKALWDKGFIKKDCKIIILLNIILIIRKNIHNFSSNTAFAIFRKPAPFHITNCLSFGKHSSI